MKKIFAFMLCLVFLIALSGSVSASVSSIVFSSWDDVTANCVFDGTSLYTCSGYSSIIVNGSITTPAYDGINAYSIAFNAINEFTVLSTGSITANGVTWTGNGGKGGTITVNAPNIVVNGYILTNGGASTCPYPSHCRGGNGGMISFNSYNISVNAPISSNGGEGGDYYTAPGGRGGTISLNAPTISVNAPITANGGMADGQAGNGGILSFNASSISVNAPITANGSDSGGGSDFGNGGNGGMILFYSSNSNILVNSFITANGGKGSSRYYYAKGGSGGKISLDIPDITISAGASISANGGSATTGGNGGTLEIGKGLSTIPLGDLGDRLCTSDNASDFVYQCFHAPGGTCGYLYIDNEPCSPYRCEPPLDNDADGIPDDEDNCPGTFADVPTKGLGTNRWIWNGSAWETKLPEGGGPDKVFTMEDTHGCSCFQILDSMGGKMTGHWKFGCSISVMEDFIMSLSPILVDTVYVDSANMDGADSEIVLESGTNYRFEAMGTWRDNSQPDHYIDAEYTTFDNWINYLDGTPNWGPDQKDLQVDDSFVDWGSYSDVNTYYLDYTGTGSTVNFRVFDGKANSSGTGPEAGWYPDNVGSLTINIYELP